MKMVISLLLSLAIVLAGCQSNYEKVIKVNNPSGFDRTDEMVKIKLSELASPYDQKLSAFLNGKELPSQLVDSDGDGQSDLFVFLLDLKANEERTVVIKENENKTKFMQRTHAEVSEKRGYKLVDGVYTGGYFESVKSTTTPPGHIDHNYYYKMEGPAWESDKVGYRLYLDWRNSTDIFGKKTSDIVLPGVGHDKDPEGHDTYHTMADWGMDIFKVGNTLGVGTFGALVDGKVEKVSKTDSTICTILNDGPILASLSIKYFGWNFGKEKSDLKSYLEITAGSRLTHYSQNINSTYSEFCTGLAKHKNTEFIRSDNRSSGAWNYIAQWGKQSLAGENDELGIALFYNNNQLVKLTEDEFSRIVVLHPTNNKMDYYFAACWDQEKKGIKNIDEFKSYLNRTVQKLNNPIIVKL